MKKHVFYVVAVALATLVLAAFLSEPTSADARRFRAFVYPDRTKPDTAIVVEDFRVNETLWDVGGVQYLWVRGPAGSFRVPFNEISQIEIVAFVGLTQVDWARYEVKVTETDPGVVHYGTTEIRVLRGIADGDEWYYYPATQRDRGTRFLRIVFGADSIAPTLAAEPPPAPAPVVEMAPPPAPPPPPPAPVDEFAALSLEELNARQPLGDVFFEFDQDTILPVAAETLARNADWMNRYPSTTVRIDGYADERGTQEYNVELGHRRANVVRDHLIGLGVSGDRIAIASMGDAQAFCTEQTEECWARNRRSHFVITAK